ncbi:MAG: N-acetyl-gamma-glutamyl-phosphate reductase [Deltaproteobacteria bacterium]|jgi:N-acetyl-gamma-glutamyl-phosphate reductase|nr:N-acetyl-gamma-glutamyl-phosphate reductase [Deltaproteobacteria bacterium]
MHKELRAGLIGVTGYTGMELVRLLAAHPRFRLSFAASRTEAGKRLGEHYPFLEKLPGANLVIGQPDARQAAARCDLVFLAVPHGAAMNMAAELRAEDLAVVDLSADFRIRDVAVFEQWYATTHSQRALLHEAVYGLPELYGEAVANAKLVANPGCYPTASILGLYAALKHGFISSEDLIIDAKSGTSGAGRKASVSTLFCEVHDSFRAYNLGKHRHTPEIEQELSAVAGVPVRLSFNPHLLPIDRGIHATIYAKLNGEHTLDEIHAAHVDCWKEAPWVRVLSMGCLPETRNVRGSMFCDIGLAVDPRTERLIICSVIDNLCRGASGQALANANLMCGLPVDCGLAQAPLMP